MCAIFGLKRLIPLQTDLGDIHAQFDLTYDETLEKMISGDCSGDYKKFLLAILH